MSRRPHCGQRTDRVSGDRAVGPRRPGRAARCRTSGSLRRPVVGHPVGGPGRRQHELDVDVRGSRRAVSASTTSSRIVSIAGQPEYVGVIVTWTRPWSSSVDVAQDAEVLDGDAPAARGRARSRRSRQRAASSVEPASRSPRRPRVRAVRGAASRRAGSRGARCARRARPPPRAGATLGHGQRRLGRAPASTSVEHGVAQRAGSTHAGRPARVDVAASNSSST